jgi:signal transduction histidine kinase
MPVSQASTSGKGSTLSDCNGNGWQFRHNQSNVLNRNKIMSTHMEKKLAKSLEREKAANRAKDEFLAALSHELRTPLNPVMLLASSGASNDELPQQVRTDFDTICKNIEVESRLIDDLMDLTLIARGKLSLHRAKVDVHAILQDTISIVENEMQKKQIFLRIHFLALHHEMFADAVRLRQIFWNVIKNAIKYTPGGGQISLETEPFASDKVLVKIRDSGIGMSAEEITTVFDKFAQGGHGLGGLGLGLAICRKLVELHSGSIYATSSGKGKGSVFSIILPVMRPVKKKSQRIDSKLNQ